MKKTIIAGLTVACLLMGSGLAEAGGRPVADPVEKNGMRIALAYDKPMSLDPAPEAGQAPDIHLLADIHALKNNPNGYLAGEWVSALSIDYELTKPGSDFSSAGRLVPILAAGGPHYGANLKLAGAGQYRLVVRFAPPSANGFYRHTDKETGVEAWWKPFTQEFTVSLADMAGK